MESIQKSCKVFKTLAKIAMILSFIWMGTILAGLLCWIVWRTGGSIMSVSVENALELTQAAGLEQMIVAMGIVLILFSLILRHGAELRESQQ